MTKVRAKYVDDIHSQAGAEPGAFTLDDTDRMTYRCPCGCGVLGSLLVGTDKKPSRKPSWKWNGDRENPTLNPSVLHQIGDGRGGAKEHWHGWLKDGFWVSV